MPITRREFCSTALQATAGLATVAGWSDPLWAAPNQKEPAPLAQCHLL